MNTTNKSVNNNIGSQIISIYNKAYQAYLDDINSSILLNIFLTDILNIFNTNCGVIMTHIDNNLKVITNSSNIMTSTNNDTLNDWSLFNKFIKKHKTFHERSYISRCINNKKSIMYNSTTFTKLFGIKLNDKFYSLKKYDLENVVLIPFVFNDEVNGMMIINHINIPQNEDINKVFQTLSNLIGTLFFNLKEVRTEEKHLNPNMTYQLILDVLNNINDELVIVDNQLRIIYLNDQFTNSFKADSVDLLYDIIPETISLMSDGNNFFHNKKLKLSSDTDLIIKSINSQGNIFHIIKVKRNICINKCGDNKNLVAYLSHELRNPIQAISTGIFIINKSIKQNTKPELKRTFSNSSNMTEDNLSDSIISITDQFEIDSNNNYGKKSIKSVIKRVDNACKNLNIIINDILDLSKIDNDELVLNVESNYLEDIIDTICDEYEEQCKKKNLNFTCKKDNNVPDLIHTDATRLYQILSNLLSNSIKYSKAGTINLEIKYKDKNLIFIISDQGKGIRKEEIHNLFKTFGFTSNSYDSYSNGLGLSVCQKIARLLGGNIEVQSEFKKGSTFTFTHPIKLSNSSSNPDLSELIENSKMTENRIKANIMIVDDDENITSLFKLLLKWFNFDFGYELIIDTVNCGTKSIQLCDQMKYDIIFMDIDLDGQDGRVVTKEILEKSKYNQNTPIIAVSANIKLNKNSPHCDCFSELILKPFNDKKIKNTLIKYLS